MCTALTRPLFLFPRTGLHRHKSKPTPSVRQPCRAILRKKVHSKVPRAYVPLYQHQTGSNLRLKSPKRLHIHFLPEISKAGSHPTKYALKYLRHGKYLRARQDSTILKETSSRCANTRRTFCPRCTKKRTPTHMVPYTNVDFTTIARLVYVV